MIMFTTRPNNPRRIHQLKRKARISPRRPSRSNRLTVCVIANATTLRGRSNILKTPKNELNNPNSSMVKRRPITT